MRAMVLEAPRTPLRLEDVPIPRPSGHQVLLEVRACGVCRTDLHIVDGELDRPKLPLILGHEIVATVVEVGTRVGDVRPADRGGNPRAADPKSSELVGDVKPGERSGDPRAADPKSGELVGDLPPGAAPGEAPAGGAADLLRPGDRVGVPWLGWTDQTCRYCRRDRENMCDSALFTGYTLDGGYAQYVVADERYCLRLPEQYGDVEAAPLLCAGLIGYRTYRLAGAEAEHLGIYGFGAAAHIVAQVAVHQGRQVYAFTRAGDNATQEFARQLGVVWAGGSDELPPHQLDAALIFAPVGPLVVAALRATAKGGVVVSGGIHMSDIPSFAYRLLWEERAIRSVANLTRRDGAEFMALADQFRIKTSVTPFALEDANAALDAVRHGRIHGAAVLQIAAPP